MFGGYADVAVSQYYMEGGSWRPATEDETDAPGLPACYLPPYIPPDPWHELSPCQDFILIAEFSEMEGPKPLITIPSNGEGNFDLNNFSLRIMSVDHQASGDSSFSITEDTHVILSENQEGIHAYVHHFTLYDSNARGFVRPFCMAYVTPCARKLMCFYEEMTNEFTKVSRFFHYGNLMLFVKDMTHYLTDLQFTREKFLEHENSKKSVEAPVKVVVEDYDASEEKILQSLTLVAIESCINEVKVIIEKASKLLDDRRLEERFQRLEEKSREEKCKNSLEESTKLSSSLTTSSGSPFSSRLLHRIKRAGSVPDIQQPSRHTPSGLEIYKPKLVRTLNRRRFDKSLRTLHQLCHWGAKEGLTRLRSIHQYFNRDLATLEIERSDSNLIEPSSTLLTIGRCVMANFSCSVDQDYSITCKHGVPTSHLLRRWVSEDTLASFKSAESFLSCHECLQSSSEPAFIMGSAYVGERDSLASYDILSMGSRDDELCNGNTTESLTIEGSGQGTPPCSGSPKNSPRHSDSCFELGSEGEAGRRPSFLWRHFSSEDLDFDSGNETSSDSRKCVKVPIISAADHIVRLRPGSPGYGILRVMELYSFAVHILFSLLIGRPLVVVGSAKHEKDVKAILSALLLFVPGHCSRSHQVVYWQTHPLRLWDLSREKLIGLCRPERKCAVPSYIKPYVSILDVEKKTFYGPTYQGVHLNTIYNKRKTMKCEKAYIAFIHSILQDYCSKALIFFHSFTLHKHSPDLIKAISSWQSPNVRPLLNRARQDFSHQLRLSTDDARIVQYLVETVKLQQVEESRYSNIPEKELPCPAFKLSHMKCSMHKS